MRHGIDWRRAPFYRTYRPIDIRFWVGLILASLFVLSVLS